MSRRREAALWAAQRLTAVILAACVLVHLFTIIYAVRGGITAGAILGRTRGSISWAAFYSVWLTWWSGRSSSSTCSRTRVP